MQDKLWKITGTGTYFADFYVMADRREIAVARASDILMSGYRAKNKGQEARSFIRSVEPVPAEVLIVIM